MIRRIFSNAVLTALGRALTLGSTILAARLLGPSEYGHYSVAVSLLMLATFPAMTGLPDLIVREVATRRNRSLAAIMRPALELSALVTAVLSLIYLALLPIAPRFIEGYEPLLALVVLAPIPFFVLRTVLGAAMRGLGHVALAVVPSDLIQPAALLLLLVLISPVEALPAFLALGGAIVLSALAAIWLLARCWPRASPEDDPSPLTRSYLFRAGLPFAAIGILAVINQRMDLLILSGFVPAQELGLYGLAVQLALIGQLPMVVANGVISAEVAAHYLRGDKPALDKAMRQVSGLLALAGLSGFVAFWLVGEPLIAFAFGQDFVGAYPYVLILLGSQLIHLASGPLGVFLNLTGHERVTLAGVALAAVVALAANITLIPIYGGYGAGIASVLSMASVNIYLAFRVWRLLGIVPGVLGLLARRPAAADL